MSLGILWVCPSLRVLDGVPFRRVLDAVVIDGAATMARFITAWNAAPFADISSTR
jgi:hypothetical protein